jgi:endonuclease/exonuclease/phosphatase family metal-dependent hydrolase
MLTHVDTAAPTLVFGDMNAPPTAPELQPLLASLHDVLHGRPDELTYPADAPTARDDYILTSSHFRVRDARVPVTQASDHRPVVASLELVPGISSR